MERCRTELAMDTGSLILGTINYCWRLVATGACFAVFSLGGLGLRVLIFPVLGLVPSGRRSERVQWVIHKSFAAFLWLMEFSGVMRMEVFGAEKLRNCQGALVLANHPTLIDVVALVSLLPAASCVVKQALWTNPFLGGVVRAAGYISNSDPDSLINDCASGLKLGRSLVIFPEGTRTQPGAPLHFQRGAAYIVLRREVTVVVPVLIDCNPSTLTKSEKWYQIPPRRFHLRIRVLDPVDAKRWVEPGERPMIAARKLTRALELFFIQELSKWTC